MPFVCGRIGGGCEAVLDAELGAEQVELVLASSRNSTRSMPSGSPARPRLRGKRILVVEDEYNIGEEAAGCLP
jgi:hypothetical protein